jgi:hypothetical protein
MKLIFASVMRVVALFSFLFGCFLLGHNAPTKHVGAADRKEVRSQLVKDALLEICPQDNLIVSEDGTAIGCSTCPAGTAFANEEGESFQLSVQRVILGNFTAPQDQNMILTFLGCEPHSMNFGGSFVFILESGRPRLLTYNRGLVTDRCNISTLASRKSFLICEGQWEAQGVHWSYIFSATFEPDGKSKAKPLFAVVDTVATCGLDLEGNTTGPVRRSSIKRTRIADVNGDTRADLLVVAELGQRVLTSAEQAACLRTKAQDVNISTQLYELKFLFDGYQFGIAPESRQALELFPDPRLAFPNYDLAP